MAEDADIAYAVPTEGSLVWQDTMAIPTGAPHPENAHAFLNFVLDAKAGAHIADTIKYATANAAAKAIMDKSYTENPSIFPPAEIVAKCEPSLYLGEEATKVRDEIWTRIQAA
jgi:spermidine/putrescine transport system substrate-binding protein